MNDSLPCLYVTSRHSNHMKGNLFHSPASCSVPLPLFFVLFCSLTFLSYCPFLFATLLLIVWISLIGLQWVVSYKASRWSWMTQHVTQQMLNPIPPLYQPPPPPPPPPPHILFLWSLLHVSVFTCSHTLSPCRFITQVGRQQVFPLPCSSRKSFAEEQILCVLCVCWSVNPQALCSLTSHTAWCSSK